VGIVEKVFMVRGQRSRSQRDQLHFPGGGIHFDDVSLVSYQTVLIVAIVDDVK